MTGDLEDEWPEEEEDQSATDQRMGTTSSTRSRTSSRRTHSVEIKDIPAGQEGTMNRVGTFVIREDRPQAHLPQTPRQRGAFRDIFSPSALEMMFEPPSPPEQSSGAMPPQAGPSRLQANRPVKPSKLSQVVSMSMVEEEDENKQEPGVPKEIKDEIVETDMPNMGGLGGHKPSADCRFTFEIPRQGLPAITPVSDNALPNPFSNQPPDAQSTPLFPSEGQAPSHPSTDPRLRLFQFQYDTYTRDHLSALVDSFGVNSPSNGSTDQSAGPTLPQEIVIEEADGTSDERNESFSRLRSSKRIKLTPPTEPGDTIRNRLREIDSAQKKRDYVGESRSLMQQIKRARDISMFSVVSNNQNHEEECEEEQGQPGEPFLVH